jgi:uncharacterized protein involved in exopolysaccharide biosynthesis
MSRTIGDWSADADKVDGRGQPPAAAALSTVDGSARPDPRRYRRVWAAAVLGALTVALFCGAAVGYSLLQPTVYGAQADILLTAQPQLSDAAVDRAMVTQTMVVTSDPVLEPVASQAGMPLPRLRDEVSVEIVGRSNVLRITVGDGDRARAVRLVELITAAYLRAPGSAPAPAVPLPAPGGSAAPNPATGDVGPLIVPSVLVPAAPLDEPLQPRPLRALAAGAILGLLVAAGVVALVLRPRAALRPAPHRE